MKIIKLILMNIRAAVKNAQMAKQITGCSFLFHFIDYIFCHIRYGCSENHYFNEEFYRLRSFERDKTVTKRRKDKICRSFNNRDDVKCFDNKALFNTVFHEYVNRDWIYTKEATKSEIYSFITKHDRILVKPIDLSKGHGIHMLDKSESYEVLCSILLNENCLLEEFINQHPAMQWGGKSVNTIRVISVVDKNGVPHILKAGMRCGVGDSIVDNFSSGGGLYPLNIDYGFVESYGEFGNQINFSGIHPGTEQIVIGFQVPHWENVLSVVRKAALVVPGVRYVGWDIAILPNGVELIEGNNSPGCTLLECIGQRRGFYKDIMSYL